MTFSPRESDSAQEIWLDFLCIESVIRIIWLKGFTSKVVYYCQISVLIKPLLKIVSLITKTNFSQIDDIELSELRMEGVSLCELIQIRIALFLHKSADEWIQRENIQNMIHKQFCNSDKVKAYLTLEAFFLVYRPMELICLAQKLSSVSPTVILNNNPFADRLSQEFSQIPLVFYNTHISHYFPFSNRLGFLYDAMISGQWYYDRFINYLKILIKWLGEIAKIIVATFMHRNQPVPKNIHTTNIGVEFTQGLFRPDENNDLFWYPSSMIAGGSIYHMEMSELDDKSQRILLQYGVRRLRVGDIRAVLKWRGAWGHGKNKTEVVVPQGKEIFHGVFSLLKLNRYLFGSAESSWLHLCLLKYAMRVNYWQSVYSRYGIKIIWSMLDGGSPQLAKSQAIENLGGFYIGSHFSNYPIYRIDNQKCYDVYFVWANHFLKNIQKHYPYSVTFVSGYVSDHYFEKQRKPAKELRNQFPGKFIISYHDNGVGKDVSNSFDMQSKIYKMLIDVLAKNSHVVLFLKPKNKLNFEVIKLHLPELENWIEQGRIALFFGETPRKAVPAFVGMASDLVVSLGISTTSAECHFAGTLAFHADLCGIVNNDFGNRGLGKIVFRDIDSLKEAIQNCIEEGTFQRYQEAVEINSMLDPFQDGKAYQRVGRVLKHLQDMLMQGESRENVIQSVKQRNQ